MARLSSIDTLPGEVRLDLDRRLAGGGMTLDTLVEYLEEQGHAISRSALGRYSKQFDQVAGKLRESREVAAAFARELGAVPNDEMGQMLTELVHTLTFKVSLAKSEDDEIDVRDVMHLARTLKDLSQSKQVSARLAMEIRTEERKRLKAEQEARLEEAGRAGGLSAEAAREARRILGFGDE